MVLFFFKIDCPHLLSHAWTLCFHSLNSNRRIRTMTGSVCCQPNPQRKRNERHTAQIPCVGTASLYLSVPPCSHKQPNPTKAKQTVWFLRFTFAHHGGYRHYLHHCSDRHCLCFAAVTSEKTKGRISPAGCFIWLPQNGDSYSRFLPQNGDSIPQNHTSLSP